jgi:hypothetical protein
MRAQAAPLGIAAVVAFSSAAGALPCADTASVTTATTAVICTADSDNGGAVNPGVEIEREPPASGDPLESDAAAAVDLIELGEFVETAVKITHMQATMTSNRYIAGHIPPVPQVSSTEELLMNAPDYMAVQLLPRIPKRKVAVGLVTLPKAPVKKSDPSPGTEQPAKPKQ